jgi:serine/threonine protein kinase
MNNYKVGAQLGSGTYGAVYAAFDKRDRPVAIKKFKKKFASKEEAEATREIEAIKELYHPNIVLTKEIIFEKKLLYIVMECVRSHLLIILMNLENRNSFSRKSKYVGISSRSVEVCSSCIRKGSSIEI